MTWDGGCIEPTILPCLRASSEEVDDEETENDCLGNGCSAGGGCGVVDGVLGACWGNVKAWLGCWFASEKLNCWCC